MRHRAPLANPDDLIRRIYSYVAYRLGDGPDAEDVTSEVFERALRYRASYSRGKGSPEAWILGIARRAVEGFNPGPVPVDQTDEVVAQGDLASEAAVRLDLHTALAGLDPRDRD